MIVSKTTVGVYIVVGILAVAVGIPVAVVVGLFLVKFVLPFLVVVLLIGGIYCLASDDS